MKKPDSLKLKIEVADTPEARLRGLSGQESLEEDTGLLFIHDQPGIYGIWMKDMKFPIDAIWLDEDYRVVDIAQDVRPDSFPKILEPLKPALYILEVNAGFAERNEIEVGDNLKGIRVIHSFYLFYFFQRIKINFKVVKFFNF